MERGIDRLDDHDEGLTYALDAEAGAPVEVGDRVEVPLGRGDKRAAGIVVRVGGQELLGSIPPDRIKPVLRPTGARLPPPLVELARWIAGYYVSPLGMVLASMMPAAVKRGTGRIRRTRLERASEEQAKAILDTQRLTPSAKAAWEQTWALAPSDFPIEPKLLARKVGAPNLAPVNRLLRLGLLRAVEMSEIRAAETGLARYRVEQAEPHPIVPTQAQRRVINGVTQSLGLFGVHLLRGVTGSGKTEVYLQVIDSVLAQGRTAIVLVPEISLTPQTAGRFVERFGGRVAVLHSGLSAAQRHRQWALASSGEARVVVGARSAVFAPLSNLGLIVVDEEHDSGYKQDQVPRYHARDVAIKRAQIERCPVLLASATPSLESWRNARTGSESSRLKGQDSNDARGGPRYRLWELTERVGGGTMPHVEVIDLVEERKASRPEDRPSARIPIIGARLAFEIGRTLDDGGQVILLLNRRGYASYICCPDRTCGWSMPCDHCDAAMVLHRSGAKGSPLPAGQVLRCHHCLAEQVVPRACPVCGKRPIPLGIGTQQLEEELAARFPRQLGDARASVARLDSDSMHTAKDYFEALARFAKGDTRILLGTQMVAKGLDFPNVRLVGVVNADTALAIPDFRASERTFQLVSQVAGRAGRGAAGGLVVVQTMNPAEPAITYAARHDYRGFADAELALRDGAELPPAARMARIVVRDPKVEKAREGAAEIALALASEARQQGTPARVLGPMECPIARIAGQFRWSVEVIAPRAAQLHGLLASLRSRGLLISDARTAVDVDPVALM